MEQNHRPAFGIFTKISLAFLIVGLVPLLIISKVFLGQFTDNIRQIVLNDAGVVLKSASSYVDSMLNEWEIRTTELYSRGVEPGIYLGDILLDKELDEPSRNMYIRRFLTGFSSVNGLRSVRFLDSEGHLYHASETVGKVVNSSEMESWRSLEISELAPSHQMLIAPLHQDDYFTNINDTVITIRRDLFDVSSIQTVEHYLGTLYLDISSDAIGQQLAGADFGSRSGFCITDQLGSEIYKSPGQTSIPADMRGRIADPDSPSLLEDQSFYYLIQPNQTGGWISTIRIHKGDILDNIRTTEHYIMTMLSVSSVVLLFLYMGFSRRISVPIRRLKEGMMKIQEGNLDTRVVIDSRDEVGILAEGLNQMAQQLGTYIEQVYGAQIRQRNAELNALKSQIKPHYLYNTLDVIRMTAIENQDRQTASMIESLARQLRYLIDQGPDTVPLDMELNNCSDYFGLMKVRYEDRIHLSIAVPEDLKQAPVLKLILQPVVENAIRHGLKPRGGSGTIWVSASSIGSFLELTVMDDGVGMAADVLDHLNRRLALGDALEEDSHPGGIGLVNAAERIRNRYGEAFGIHAESTPDMGTMVIIRLPYEVNPKEVIWTP